MRQKLFTMICTALICATSMWSQTFNPYTTPLTFEAMEAGATVTYTLNETNPVQYSTDGTTWTNYSSAITLAAVGNKVSFRGNNDTYDDSSDAKFQCSADCYIYGNIMSLVEPENYATATELTAYNTFCKMFLDNTHIKNHATKDLALPATTLAKGCYYNMFYGCTGLTRAPELPATTLANNCYRGMFKGCTGLTSAPELPATTLASNCYREMFQNCSILSSVTCFATNYASSATQNWLSGVASSGTFYAPTNGYFNNLNRSVDSIPSGWNIGTAYASITETPLTFEATATNTTVTYTWNAYRAVQYSLNGGAWTDYSSAITLAAVGDKVSFRGNNDNYNSNSAKFTCSKNCYIYGNIMSLVEPADFANATTLSAEHTFYHMFQGNTHIKNHSSKAVVLPATTLSDYCYEGMFQGCTGLTSVPEDLLPATTLADNCYESMFQGCTHLTSAPALPATTLAANCYKTMFKNCSGLTAAPMLPATTLANNCYSNMFYGCTGLTSAPELPATTMISNCYAHMFENCTGLTDAPVLSATNLATNCYIAMFQGCTGLTSAPVLPATTLANCCYQNMFYGCTGLTSAPELPATTLVSNCYYQMFYGCTGLTSAPELPATNLVNICYYQMFYNCTNLSSVTCLATSRSNTNATTEWLSGVAESGTFYAPSNGVLNNEERGVSTIPVNWTFIPFQASLTSAPTAIDDFVYDGSAHALLSNAGTAEGGTMNYSLNNTDWSEDIPTATGVGNYTVYYMVVGDASHADYTPEDNTINVSINPAPLTCTADDKEVTYGDAAPEYTVSYSGWVNSETQAVLGGSLAFDCDYSAGSNVGGYTITPSGVTASNYDITFNTGTLTVNKADAVITDVPAAIEGLVYTGAAQTLISAGSATGGELQYKVDASAWSTDLPQATAIGDHTVYYKVVGDGNHNSVDEASFTVSIAAVTVLYDNTDPTTDIAGMVEAGEAYDLTVSRTIYADGYFNTICLPFAVSAGELSNPAHPLYGYTDLKAFSGAEVTGSGQNLFINIYVEDATEIAAGVPYLISYPGNRADIVNPTFPAAVCTATAPDAVTRDGVTFQGMFAPVHITTYAENTTEDYLFLGENNRLLWPNDDGSSMRGFRAYFIIHRNNIPAAAAPRGTAARIMQRDNTATGIEQVQGDEVQSTKLLRDGQLIIIRNGVEYNANGQMLK